MLSLDGMEYIAERTAEILYWKSQNPVTCWVSQNKAWEHYGGRALVTSLTKQGKVKVRRTASRNEYYVQDIEKYSKPERYIKSL